MNEMERQHAMAVHYKAHYLPGTRICLSHMDDPYAPIPSGTRVTVDFVDDIGHYDKLSITGISI